MKCVPVRNCELLRVIPLPKIEYLTYMLVKSQSTFLHKMCYEPWPEDHYAKTLEWLQAGRAVHERTTNIHHLGLRQAWLSAHN
jgi:hypothetical protein